MMNWTKKVALKPMKTSAQDRRAIFSSNIFPVIFGHQYQRPPRNPMTVPPIIT